MYFEIVLNQIIIVHSQKKLPGEDLVEGKTLFAGKIDQNYCEEDV